MDDPRIAQHDSGDDSVPVADSGRKGACMAEKESHEDEDDEEGEDAQKPPALPRPPKRSVPEGASPPPDAKKARSASGTSDDGKSLEDEALATRGEGEDSDMDIDDSGSEREEGNSKSPSDQNKSPPPRNPHQHSNERQETTATAKQMAVTPSPRQLRGTGSLPSPGSSPLSLLGLGAEPDASCVRAGSNPPPSTLDEAGEMQELATDQPLGQAMAGLSAAPDSVAALGAASGTSVLTWVASVCSEASC
jgi:hypothetical protein